MASNIFLIGSDNALVELKRSPYDSEDLLQRLVADYPAMLGSATGADGGLLLVKREHGVPDSENGTDRWSLDHLFLDRNAVPVLVEVKRASDTRARREVVAQMLDYAANGVAYWPLSGLIEAFNKTCEEAGVGPEHRLSEFLGGSDSEPFWKAVESNLKAGRVRMVFLADEIGKELRRIVEFLNEQMRPAEVLAVEVVQYVNPSGVRTLVPTLLGATERAQSAKEVSAPKEPISIETWLDTLAEMKGGEARQGAEMVLEWMRRAELEPTVSSSQDSIYGAARKPDGKTAYPFFLRRSTGNFEVSLQNLKYAEPYASDESRLTILSRMKSELPGVRISTTKSTGWPAVPLPLLLRHQVWQPLEAIISEIPLRLRGE